MTAKKKGPLKKPGRKPQPVPKAMADRLIEWVSEGETVRAFCRQPGTPGFVSVYRWLDKDPAFAERFAEARRIGLEAIAQQTLDIADAAVDKDDVPAARLQVDTRLKLLAVWDPGRYGQKVEMKGKTKVEHSGKIETNGPPIPTFPDLKKAAAEFAKILDGDQHGD